MARTKNKLVENVTISDFAAEGKCIIKHEGEVIFVEAPNMAPGDIVDIVIKRKKKNYSEGIVLNIHRVSQIRTEPFCEHFGVCGGCKWQHIPYEIQLKQKQKQVEDQLVRIGHLKINTVVPILASENTTYYRNKLEFTFSNSRWLTKDEIENGSAEYNKNVLGFHVPRRFDKVFPINKCYLQPEPSNSIRNFVYELAIRENYSFYDHIVHQGFLRSLMIRTTTTNELMVVIQFAQNNLEQIEYILNQLIANFKEITSLHYIINQKRNDTFHDLEIVHFYGKENIEENLDGLRFQIAPKSFYQTNPIQAEKLYQIAKEFAEFEATDIVYDLYTGTGTIALFISQFVKKVVGVEYVEAAIEDAKVNALRNNITNAVFYAGDMKKVLTKEFVQQNETPNVIILDPPRGGMDKEVVEVLLEILPKRIIYVSCNAATQARDLALMADKYEIVISQAVDMFPHTHHVENVVKLVRK